ARWPQGQIISPADSRINCYPSVQESTRFWIKGQNFSISSLLKDSQLFEDGAMAICRLAPQDYHRFHSPVDGTIALIYSIEGAYYTVNPMAVRQKYDIFTENARTVILI